MATVATSKPVSNIAMAFAAHSAANKIPITRDGGNAAASDFRSMLLTPPNSISPTLPAQNHRSGRTMAASPHPPSHVDSDIDLEDAVEHAAAQDLPSTALSREALAGVDAAGQITAAMLAKYHLPNILLGHGSMPVRDIMAHLAQSVPGYSRISSAKARRLVVAALEHRAGGGLNGEVKFEKVGWGRWHVKGQGTTQQGVPIGTHNPSGGPTPPASVDSAGGLMFSRGRDMYSGSWAPGSMESRDEDMADRMSLDDDGGSSVSESDSDASENDLEMDLDDETDEEDWSAIGPEALRQGSYRTASRQPLVYRDYNHLARTSGERFRSASAQAQSVPHTRAGRMATLGVGAASYNSVSRGSGLARVLDSTAEREAAAASALLAMGSM